MPRAGQNMWDHVLFSIAYRVETPTSSRLVDDPQYAAQAVLTTVSKKPNDGGDSGSESTNV